MKTKTAVMVLALIPLGVLAYAQERITDNINLPFVNDAAVIGEWTSVDFVKEPADFTPGAKSFTGSLYLKDLTFLPGGKTGQPWWTWTKGVVMHSGDKTAAAYSIKEISGHKYMFFEWKSGDYTIRHRKPEYYVLEQTSGVPPVTAAAKPGERIVDNIDLPFVNDPAVIGDWTSVDFVREPADFTPGVKGFGDELYLKGLTFRPNGKTAKSWETWTKGFVMHSGDKTASKYLIKNIGSATYMFFEWKSGDYVFGHMKPQYYVLKKN